MRRQDAVEHVDVARDHLHAANRVAVEFHLHQLLRALLAQVCERAPLHDREQQLTRPVRVFVMPTAAALLPAQRQLETLRRVVPLTGNGGRSSKAIAMSLPSVA